MDKLKAVFARYRETAFYLLFGGLTTLVNMASYWALHDILRVPNVAGTICAWAASVLFAFFTNKRWVFRSPDWSGKALLREGGTFFACRAATGGMDVAIMYIAVDLMGWNSMVMKLASNILVIIVNFVASKLWIFKKK